jgi:hypothetical protein
VDPTLPIATVHQHDVHLITEAQLGDSLRGAGRVEAGVLGVVGPQRGDGSVVDEDSGVHLGPRVGHQVQGDDIGPRDGADEHASGVVVVVGEICGEETRKLKLFDMGLVRLDVAGRTNVTIYF